MELCLPCPRFTVSPCPAQAGNPGWGGRKGKGAYCFLGINVFLVVPGLADVTVAHCSRSECKAQIEKVIGAQKSEWGQFLDC